MGVVHDINRPITKYSDKFSIEDFDYLLDDLFRGAKISPSINLPIGLLGYNPVEGVIPNFMTESMFRDGIYHIGGGILTGLQGWIEFDKVVQEKAKEYINNGDSNK